MKNEITRKIIHMSTLVFPAAYLFQPKKTVLIGLAMCIVVAVIVELFRFFNPVFSDFFEQIAGTLLRRHEKKKITSATNLLLAFYVAVLIFAKPVAIAAMLFVSVSDALSALVGKKWGKNNVYKDKTIIGCLVFAVSGIMILIFVPGLQFYVGLAGLVSAIIADLFIENYDDNITIPLISGIVMQIALFL